MKSLARHLSLLALCCLLNSVTVAISAPLSEEQVSNAVSHAITIHYPATSALPGAARNQYGLSKKAVARIEPLTRNGSKVGYVASLSPSGFYLLSTDDQLPPWKLRADDGTLTNLPPDVLAVLLTEMAEDQQALKSLQNANLAPDPKFKKQWTSLLTTGDATNSDSGPPTGSPGVYLLTTTWNQNDPYNLYCPTASGGPAGKAYAGCTACALSQILRYHTQPRVISQDHQSTDALGTHYIHDATMNPYDWPNMPNAITSASPSAQQQAVAQLMYHAAVALDSTFAADITSAYPSSVKSVLQTYFGFTSGDFEYRSPTYTTAQWYNKIAANVDAKKPVFYSMYEPGPIHGHAFVCDGYQNGNEVHFNFGWSGAWNGPWYNLDSVVSAGGYNWTIHGAVFGITPPPPTITFISPATLAPSASPQSVTITGTCFNGPSSPNPSMVVIIDPSNNSFTKVPSSVTGTSMQCTFTAQSTGTWKAKVVNGLVESSPYSFSVSSATAQLAGLSVSGPAYIQENGSGQFTATATFTDGSQQTVTSSASWTENSSVTTITSSGLLMAGSVNSDTPVTVTASYTAGSITKTATANVTVANSASCGTQIYEAVVNGNFASGSSSWSLTGSFQADSRFSTCYSCPGYAYLANADGSGGNNLTGTMSQSIYIPANATSATLGYYYRITTTDSTTVAYDHLYLNLVLPGGTLVGLDDRSNVNANTAYAYRSFDITSYKGQTVTIKFTGSTDSSGPTVFRVDDVSVIISAPNPVVPVLFGVGGPTNVTEGTTAQYNGILVNCDGSVQPVTPTWSVNPSAASINSSGLLTANTVSSDTAVTVTGTYGAATINYPVTIVNVVPVFSSLVISGPAAFTENSSAQFYATAVFTDGSTQAVAPSWSENSTATTISAGGLLTAGEVASDTTVTVSASHTIGSITKSATLDVTVQNVAPPVTLTSLSISGPSSVYENSTAQFAATATFSDGSSESVIPTWQQDSVVASISPYGVLTTGEVSADTPMKVSASFTSGAITRNATNQMMILNTVLPTITARLAGASQIAIAWATNSPGFTLEYTTNLPPTSWVSNASVPVVVGNQYTVTNSLTGKAKFYRLRK